LKKTSFEELEEKKLQLEEELKEIENNLSGLREKEVVLLKRLNK
jgi:hypothetical protein